MPLKLIVASYAQRPFHFEDRFILRTFVPDGFIISPILIVELFAILQPVPTSEANVLFHPRVARQARMDQWITVFRGKFHNKKRRKKKKKLYFHIDLQFALSAF